MYLSLICVLALSVNYKDIVRAASSTSTETSPSTQVTDNRTLSSTVSDHFYASNETVHSHSKFPSLDSGAAMRTFYVVAFAMATVVIYFVVRAVRLHRRKSKSRKYGVITSTSSLEMEPLEKGEEDDDEDTTLFEVHHHNKYGQK